jgi:hypothetical protein
MDLISNVAAATGVAVTMTRIPNSLGLVLPLTLVAGLGISASNLERIGKMRKYIAAVRYAFAQDIKNASLQQMKLLDCAISPRVRKRKRKPEYRMDRILLCFGQAVVLAGSITFFEATAATAVAYGIDPAARSWRLDSTFGTLWGHEAFVSFATIGVFLVAPAFSAVSSSSIRPRSDARVRLAVLVRRAVQVLVVGWWLLLVGLFYYPKAWAIIGVPLILGTALTWLICHLAWTNGFWPGSCIVQLTRSYLRQNVVSSVFALGRAQKALDDEDRRALTAASEHGTARQDGGLIPPATRLEEPDESPQTASQMGMDPAPERRLRWSLSLQYSPGPGSKPSEWLGQILGRN